jgi:hypothetical protein
MAMMPPRSAQRAGSQACSIQQMAAHMQALVMSMPNHGLSEEHLSRGEDEALRGKVHGHVGGLHGDVDAFKVGPHGGGGVGETEVREGVRGEQKAEVVGNERERNGKGGKNGKAEKKSGQADGENSEAAALRQRTKDALDAGECGHTKPRSREGHNDGDESDCEFDSHG